jgi:molecular chaperone GrpE
LTFSIKWQYFCSLWKKLKEKAMSKNDKMKQSEREEAEGFDDLDINEQEVAEENVADALSELEEEFQREKDRYMRLFAEFENYKKRTARERIEMFKTAGEDILLSLLPILDDFERAIKEIEKSDDENLVKGVALINQKLRETLRSKGLELIEVKIGDTFNADTHEAITQIAAPEPSLKGKIIDVVEKGYKLGEKIIRYPKVVIGN